MQETRNNCYGLNQHNMTCHQAKKSPFGLYLQIIGPSVEKGLITRDDYKEVIELTLVVLGNPPEKIHWRAPGAIHQAWWMTKLLYAFKIFLFREQQDVFHTTKKEQMQLQRFVQFDASLYSKAWIEAKLSAQTPGY
ncbi:hypothetical protein AVEN_236415-1 [Araneus ventricosus]|uniref:Uncharacterized protein n=1 Tax=Araneus ventricosus TaxID=182803 RepID=A0A4Y2IWB9_ARAVE|nr:hypothetical protein AVEN_236415-1 [Araneus ventricosus]